MKSEIVRQVARRLGISIVELPPVLFRRDRPRDDHTRPILAQTLETNGLSDRPWPTREPRVRMDITTAVQIASTSESLRGCPLDLLGDSEPVALPAHEWPTSPESLEMVAGLAVYHHMRWRDRLKAKIRRAREDAMYDRPAVERRRENRLELVREERLMRALDILCWLLGTGGVIMALATIIQASRAVP